MISFVMMLFYFNTASAHLMGNSPWCISNSPVHFECFYDSEDTCEHMLKSTRGASTNKYGGNDSKEGASCVVFPYEFSQRPDARNPEVK